MFSKVYKSRIGKCEKSELHKEQKKNYKWKLSIKEKRRAIN